MSQACSALIAAGPVPAAVRSGPGGFRNHWPTAGPPELAVVGRLATPAARYAGEQAFADDGYRVVMNCNGDGGQTVFQIHLHLLAGAPLGHFGVAERPRG